jgi:hypothetical protein
MHGDLMKKQILVAGDVCLDVLGISMPAPAPKDGKPDNWRQTGETRTHLRLGGALLLAQFVKACVGEDTGVNGPLPCLPAALSCGKTSDQPLSATEFLQVAERLTRKEVVHSLIHLNRFPAKPGDKEADTLRIQSTNGFAGPTLEDGEPSLKILPPAATGPADVVVLDDTGNLFRRTTEQWPAVITHPEEGRQPLIVHKLHRPLPTKPALNEQASSGGGNPSPLWNALSQHHAGQRIVVITVEDLRECEVPISRGLSWERTALDLVWHLLNEERFEPLRNCSHLVVRLGLDGALYWRHTNAPSGDDFRAWLIYNPAGIEGTGENSCDGKMVAYGSAFTAALVSHLVSADSTHSLGYPAAADGEKCADKGVVEGIQAGLLASYRLLQTGFGSVAGKPDYPGQKLFAPRNDKEIFFACQPVPIIRGAAVPDRGYWRLLESIFCRQDGTAPPSGGPDGAKRQAGRRGR